MKSKKTLYFFSFDIIQYKEVMMKKRPILPLYWIFLSFLSIYLDYLTGPFIHFPIVYLIPILLAVWNSGIWWGIGLSIPLASMRFVFTPLWPNVQWTFFETTINSLIRVFVFILFSYLINKIYIEKQHLEHDLDTLKGILPICGFCKKIRNDDGSWDTIEKYITSRSEASFSHGLCPDCAKKHYPDYFKD
jgi:hypothetical protein